MKSTWQALGFVTVLAAFCLAPNDCDQASSGDDAGDATTAATTGDASGSNPARVGNSALDCRNRAACALVNSVAFSTDDCQVSNAADGRRADANGCGDLYDAFLSCVAAIQYDCTQDVQLQIRAACPNQTATYTACN